MPKTFFFYLVVIGLLSAWVVHLQHQKHQQMVHYAGLVPSINAAGAVLQHHLQNRHETIIRTSQAYKSPTNDTIRRQAGFVANQIDTLTRFCAVELGRPLHTRNTSPLPPFSFAKDVLADRQRADWYFQQQTVLDDSLRFYMQGHDRALSELNAILGLERQVLSQKVLTHARPASKAMWLLAESLDNVSAAHCALYHLAHKTEKIEDVLSIKLLPSLSSVPDCIRVGEVFEGELYAAPYSSRKGNISMFVNDQLLAMDGHMGSWTAVYRTPGHKKLAVKVVQINALTNEQKTFTKEFLLTICP
jgi:hypothetical protein